MKRAKVRFRGAREKGAMVFVECLGLARRHDRGLLVEGSLGRSLGMHDATELVGGMCHGNGCRQETTPPPRHILHNDGMELSHPQSGAPRQTRARSLRESKVQFVVGDTWPFRERELADKTSD